jgi:hypothetical protein
MDLGNKSSINGLNYQAVYLTCQLHSFLEETLPTKIEDEQFQDSSSAFALYIERFAYYCSFYFMPFRPSNSDFGCFEEGESTSGSSFACP